MLAMEKACERIRKESGGDINIQFYNNLQLGSEPSMHSQLRSGALELMTTSGLILQTLVPVAGISGMAFAFKDYPQVWAALDGEVRDLWLPKEHGQWLPKCHDEHKADQSRR